MTVVVAILQAGPGQADTLEGQLRDVAERTRREPGALDYTVCRQDGGRFLVVEQYTDRGACDAHFAAPYVTELLARFPQLLEAEPQVEIAERIIGPGR